MTRNRTHVRHRRAVALAGVLALASTTLVACSDGQGAPDATDDPCVAFEGYGTFTDTSVTIRSSLTGTEADKLTETLAQFEQCTGIDVVHAGSDTFESSIVADAADGQEPDLAIVPQLGLVAELVDDGELEELPMDVNVNIEEGWERQWVEAGTFGTVPYAAPLQASVKSMVWYSPVAFQEEGYAVPTTWQELEALTAQVVQDHPDGAVTPWCLGIADGGATGWPVTDWLEDVMLRQWGVGVYDDWASHGLPVDTAQAVSALDTVGDLLLADGRVPGGREGAVATSVTDTARQLLDGSCLMLHASSSFESALPDGTVVTDPTGTNPVTVTPSGEASEVASGGPGADGTTTQPADSGQPAEAAQPAADGATGQATQGAPSGRATTDDELSTFYLPADDDAESQPVLVGGDYLVAFHSSPAVTAVMSYLTSPEWAQERVALGGVATANRAVDPASVPSDVGSRATELLQSRETVVRFDASDRMPPSVGTGTMWTALTDWTAGRLSSRQALAQVEDSWPRATPTPSPTATGG